ncbi:FAD-binding oxidoreductase [Arthrobacter sp. NIO-1057]|uniref:FAD-binding oxidoreductase n=1 Tax=Arthrobacter sp. NIO-1057 TaxID=993071 RepID=UPI00071CC3C4|nr:FAD-linked oxidase C-terminal domain-containing protein [Arthrobacter sp. NIO-1057]KSU62025.1 FAD-linked oxidase [Arthrobacter sp. NIO-1057]SCC53894.1 glycolate oxidase [Arthrobacter sp. NIO-1057]
MSSKQMSFLEKLRTVLPSELIVQDELVLSENSRDFGQLAVEPLRPIAVLFPTEVHEVQQVMQLATEFSVPVISRGAGTGVSGGVHVIDRAIILNLSKMNRIIEIRPDDEIAVVEPGVINQELNIAAAEYGLMYAPDPASYKMSTLGGNIATNAGGLRCAKYGVTRESVLSLDVVLADGRLIRVGKNTFKGVAGYDLTALFTGSEGTLGIVVRAVLRLRYLPVDERDLSLLFPTLEDAVHGVQIIAKARIQPAILELIDHATMQVLDGQYSTSLADEGGAMLLIRLDGYGAMREEEVIRDSFANHNVVMSVEGSGEATQLIEMRRTSRGDTKDDAYRTGEDVAIPKSKMVEYVRRLQNVAKEERVQMRLISHVGDGNLHPTFSVEPNDGSDPLDRLNRVVETSVRLALEMGGTITGEHGVGLIKKDWLPWEQSAEVLQIQKDIKSLLDPSGILNPGKAI